MEDDDRHQHTRRRSQRGRGSGGQSSGGGGSGGGGRDGGRDGGSSSDRADAANHMPAHSPDRGSSNHNGPPRSSRRLSRRNRETPSRLKRPRSSTGDDNGAVDGAGGAEVDQCANTPRRATRRARRHSTTRANPSTHAAAYGVMGALDDDAHAASDTGAAGDGVTLWNGTVDHSGACPSSAAAAVTAASASPATGSKREQRPHDGVAGSDGSNPTTALASPSGASPPLKVRRLVRSCLPPDHWARLPRLVWGHIFSYLRTVRRWRVARSRAEMNAWLMSAKLACKQWHAMVWKSCRSCRIRGLHAYLRPQPMRAYLEQVAAWAPALQALHVRYLTADVVRNLPPGVERVTCKRCSDFGHGGMPYHELLDPTTDLDATAPGPLAARGVRALVIHEALDPEVPLGLFVGLRELSLPPSYSAAALLDTPAVMHTLRDVNMGAMVRELAANAVVDVSQAPRLDTLSLSLRPSGMPYVPPQFSVHCGPSLTSLSLHASSRTVTQQNQFHFPTSLRSLTLSGFRLLREAVPRDTFRFSTSGLGQALGALPGLEVLGLRKLIGFRPRQFLRSVPWHANFARSLHTLILSRNPGVDDGCVVSLPPSLRVLDLSQTNVTDVCMPVLPRQLQVLRLVECPDVRGETFGFLPTSLKRLDLCESGVLQRNLGSLPPDVVVHGRHKLDAESRRTLPDLIVKVFVLTEKDLLGHAGVDLIQCSALSPECCFEAPKWGTLDQLRPFIEDRLRVPSRLQRFWGFTRRVNQTLRASKIVDPSRPLAQLMRRRTERLYVLLEQRPEDGEPLADWDPQYAQLFFKYYDPLDQSLELVGIHQMRMDATFASVLPLLRRWKGLPEDEELLLFEEIKFMRPRLDTIRLADTLVGAEIGCGDIVVFQCARHVVDPALHLVDAQFARMSAFVAYMVHALLTVCNISVLRIRQSDDAAPGGGFPDGDEGDGDGAGDGGMNDDGTPGGGDNDGGSGGGGGDNDGGGGGGGGGGGRDGGVIVVPDHGPVDGAASATVVADVDNAAAAAAVAAAAVGRSPLFSLRGVFGDGDLAVYGNEEARVMQYGIQLARFRQLLAEQSRLLLRQQQLLASQQEHLLNHARTYDAALRRGQADDDVRGATVSIDLTDDAEAAAVLPHDQMDDAPDTDVDGANG